MNIKYEINGAYFLNAEVVREDIIHISVSKKMIEKQDFSLVDPHLGKDQGKEKIKKTKENICLITPRLTACINLTDGSILWKNTKNQSVLLQEGERTLEEIPVYQYVVEEGEQSIKKVKTVDGERNLVQNIKKQEVRKAYCGTLNFCFQEKEGIYGFGQGEEGYYNLRNHTRYLYQHNLRIPMPMFYSDAGYGIFFDCSSLMIFSDDENGAHLFMDTIDQMDYYMVAGPEPEDVIRGFRYLTGKAAMLPKWAFGYIQSKEQYYTAKELESVVARYRDLHIPIDCVVQDWNSWPASLWGEKKLDEKRYGDMKECAKRIHQMHAHTMVSVWPNMNDKAENYKEFKEKGLLLNDDSTYNAFSEEARELYFKQAKTGLMDQGFDSWWCDSSEPFSGPDWRGEVKKEEWKRYELAGEEHKKHIDPAKANVYSLVHAQGIYENQRKAVPKRRVLNLTRSGYAGSQRYGVTVWSGDICATWETMKRQITEGINMGLSGYPYWTLDIGGFFVVHKNYKHRGCGCNQDSTMKWFWKGDYEEGISNPAYRELYTRWLQFGVFLPMFRSHGTDTPREIWNLGNPGDPFYEACAKAIRLRYQILPYIYSIAGSVTHNDEVMMRSLLFDFRMDPEARKIKDEYMFGKELLVCPVVEPMFYTKDGEKQKDRTKRGRSCYLPIGAGWTDYWNGKTYEGGQRIWRETPLDEIPLFIRNGSILPTKDGMQYSSDKKEAPMTIVIVPGAHGQFTLYEDAGDDYEYENGSFSTITFSWRQEIGEKGVLTIGERVGSYDGMEEEREFVLEIFRGSKKKVRYNGKEMHIQL